MKWEYKILAFNVDDPYGPRNVTIDLERDLNLLGSEGWEVIWVRKGLDDEDDEITVIFKRPSN
jgi:hypothetical protein